MSTNVERPSKRRSFAKKQPVNDSILENKENIDGESLHEMIQMLRQYETLCIEKEDFSLAEEAKNKIQFLKHQMVIMNKELTNAKQQENIQEICKEGEEEVKNFQQYWDHEVQVLIANLKQIEDKLCEQQTAEVEQFEEALALEPVPAIKYSSKVLELRSYLGKLIKIRNYKEAENSKNQLKSTEAEEEVKWGEKFEEKKKIKLEKLLKRHNNQLQALRTKLQGIFNEKIKQRDSKFQILLKKNRKRRIESSKVKDKTRSRVMAPLTESNK